MSRVALALAVVLVASSARAADKPAARPAGTLVTLAEHGFELTLPPGWARIEQDTGQGDREPLLKAANDGRTQFLAVLLEKGPTDDAEDSPAVARANLEKGFAAAPGYRRLSLKPVALPRTPAAPRDTVPGVDLWFTMTRGKAVVTVGVRAIFLRGYVLTLVVDCPGKQADAATRKLLTSFHPVASVPASQPAPAPAPTTPPH
jgi:hypothetical protein